MQEDRNQWMFSRKFKDEDKPVVIFDDFTFEKSQENQVVIQPKIVKSK